MKISEIEKCLQDYKTNNAEISKEMRIIYVKIREEEKKAQTLRNVIKRNKLEMDKLHKQITVNVYSEDRYQVGYKIKIPKSGGYYTHKYFESISKSVEADSYLEIIKRTPKMFNCKLNVNNDAYRWSSDKTFKTVERRFSFRVFSRFLKELNGDDWINDLDISKRDESIADLISE